MTTALDDPVAFAEVMAPVLDRAAIGVHMAVPRDRYSRLREQYGIDRLGFLIELRQPVLAGIPIALIGLAAIVRYPPPGFIDEEIDRQVGGGMLVRDDDRLLPTERARSVVADVVALQDDVASELWSWRAATIERLDELAVKAIDAGRGSGGPAFAVQTSAPVPSGRSPAFRLWSNLWPLRYHRADAHAAAWAAEGLTAHEMATLASGEQRDRIEAETNRRAAPPWAGLSEHERLELLAGLGALPGVGQPTTAWPGTPRR
ncbi:MAG: hypothetical protein M3431_04810 [Actinomycetota bacterium]|nr:hypothetical protein [Actinomycetota bacterium]